MLTIQITLTPERDVNKTINTHLSIRSIEKIDGEDSGIMLMCEGLGDGAMLGFALHADTIIGGTHVSSALKAMYKHRLTFTSINV